jgi:hypothetical protein
MVLAVQAISTMGTKLTSASFATVAPFFEAFEPLGRQERVLHLVDLQALMDLVVDGESCRVWSATVTSLEGQGGLPACALVVGPRFPGDADPELLELTALPAEGYAVCGSLLGWAGWIPAPEPNGRMFDS